MADSQNLIRICLWSGPRNISTALMYSFAQRADTKVYDEPLYGHYLCNTDADSYHPGAQEIIDTMECDGEKVVQMMMGHHDKPVVFFKNMTHHLLIIDKSFMNNVVNVILTRDPHEMIPSFAKVIKNPSMNDVGYKAHIDLLRYLDDTHAKVIVIDSKKVLMNPKEISGRLCHDIDIQPSEEMFSWQKGVRKEDGVWAKHWYKNVHSSKGFITYEAKHESFPEYLRPLLDNCIPYYKELKDRSL